MAVRIAGVIIPQNKRIVIALTYIYGIGQSRAEKIVADAQIDPNTRVKELSEEHAAKIREVIKKNYKIEGDLKREVLGNIKRLKDIKAYRGVRHDRRMPVRGQRTKTNQRTAKGNRRITLGSGRVAATKK